MTLVEKLAAFAEQTRFEQLSQSAVLELKIRIADALACSVGALEGEPILMLQAQIADFGGVGHCTLFGGGSTAPDRAALFNGALVRYLDFNDSYLAKGETCHPSDNLGAVLAAAEYANGSGKDFLAALALAYQVQCRLSDVAPVRARGFDHTTQGSYAVAAGVSRALGLDRKRTANAISIAGTALNALRVTRTGRLSHWKGLAYPHTAFAATHAAFLAMRGITAPPEVFEGNKGFMDAIAGRFAIDWAREDLERVRRTIVKKYNAEIHSQSTLEAVLELQTEHAIRPEDIERLEIDIFDVAYHIIGGGEEGAKIDVHTKEEADHSLPYIVAVALLDRQVMPQQYQPERIARADVRSLLRKVVIRSDDSLSGRFPDQMPCRVFVHLRDGSVLEKEKHDYEGFHSRPLPWDGIVRKFESLTEEQLGESQRAEILRAVADLEHIRVRELTALLARIPHPVRRSTS